MFKEVEERPDFPKLEQEMLKFWEESQSFAASVRKNKGQKKWSFFDGPITANNPMGVHHAWGRTYKDIFIRYKAMQGFDQRYQNGFDCQGLWVEVEVEKELGLNSKREILTYGLDKFAEKCKERVKKFSGIQTKQSLRLGQWMDWDNSYYTMADTNIECIWHFLKKCHDNGWLYLGKRCMPWCSRCGTSLSHHELYDSYKDMKHKSVTLALPLVEKPGEYIMVWTTTPWTLAANTALAVHPDLEYAKVEEDGKILYISKGTLSRLKSKAKATVLGTVLGRELVGLHYRGPMEIPARANLDLKVVPWKQVGEAEGTGVVHIAPGCGAEDYELSKAENLAVIEPIDEAGYYASEQFGPLYQKNITQAPDLVFAHLKEHGYLYATEMYEHRYPVCWRCRQELAFRLVSEWFIRCDEIREPMKKAAADVTWLPDYAGSRMQNWLDNMGDWCISRRRFWGLPLPLYRCDCGELTIIGSKKELQEKAVCGLEGLQELHRPWIDKVKIKCPKCGQPVSRIEEVGDCWLDAGIIPFSTLDYLKKGKHYWKQWYPAEFITEMVEQVRLWFYSLLFMSVTLEGKAPYQHVLTFSAVVDAQGNQFSKTLGNSIPFDEAADKIGADVMRWMYAGQNINTPLKFGYEPAKEVYRKLLTFWNVYKFFVTYATLDKPDLSQEVAPDKLADMDRWLISQLNVYLQEVQGALEKYDSMSVVKNTESFWEDLSNWYLRRSRRRFWKSESDTDKAAAYYTLYHTLCTLCKALAPVLPFSMEYIYQNLVRSVNPKAPTSIHLNDYPAADPAKIDNELVEDMATVMRVCTLGHAARDEAATKVRQPLARLLVFSKDAKVMRGVNRFRTIITDELNVKQIQFMANETEAADLYHYEVKPDLKLLGPKYGKKLKDIKESLAKLNSHEVNRLVSQSKPVPLPLPDETILLEATEILVAKHSKPGYAATNDKDLFVALDLTLTEELKQEGIARDLVRMIQEMRKSANFQVSDRINVGYETDSKLVKEAIVRFSAYVQEETLAASLDVKSEGEAKQEVKLGNESVVVTISRIK